MIYCSNTIYAKVWKILRVEEKYMDLRVSTSEKDTDGNYVDSTWFPRIIGHAFNSLKGTLKEGDKIVITKAAISNPSYKATDGTIKSSFKFRVFEAKIDDKVNKSDTNNEAEASTTQNAEQTTASESKEEIPW